MKSRCSVSPDHWWSVHPPRHLTAQCSARARTVCPTCTMWPLTTSQWLVLNVLQECAQVCSTCTVWLPAGSLYMHNIMHKDVLHEPCPCDYWSGINALHDHTLTRNWSILIRKHSMCVICPLWPVTKLIHQRLPGRYFDSMWPSAQIYVSMQYRTRWGDTYIRFLVSCNITAFQGT